MVKLVYIIMTSLNIYVSHIGSVTLIQLIKQLLLSYFLYTLTLTRGYCKPYYVYRGVDKRRTVKGGRRTADGGRRTAHGGAFY
jgi:hypothetical protein